MGKNVVVSGRLCSAKNIWKSDDDDKFHAVVVLNPGEETKIKDALMEVTKAEYPNFPKKKPAKFTMYSPRKGDDEEGFPCTFDKFFIRPKSNDQPVVAIKRKGQPARMLEAKDDIVYAGCEVKVIVEVYCGPGGEKYGPYATCSLKEIYYAGKGEKMRQGGITDEAREEMNLDTDEEEFDGDFESNDVADTSGDDDWDD